MSFKKGDIIPMEGFDEDRPKRKLRVRVTGTGKHGVHVVWLDGPLKGRPAYIVTEALRSRGRSKEGEHGAA
jgi:hypothetical protein